MDYVRKVPERFFGYFSFQPHNIYLMWLVEGGIFMLLSWIYFFAVYYFYGVKVFSTSESRDVKIISLAAVSSLTAFLINGITETVFYHYQVVPFVFLFFGILLRLNHFEKEKGAPSKGAPF
jgi:O-antigen ligase